MVHSGFEQTICRLNTQAQITKNLETQLKQVFLQVKSGTFNTIGDIVVALSSIMAVYEVPPFLKGGIGGIASLAKRYRTLQKSPFTSKNVLPFFEAVITNLPEDRKAAFAPIHDLFWHQLNDLLQMKAVLVNTKTKEALITRLDVTTSLESQGLDTLNFENTVDDRMYHSVGTLSRPRGCF